MEVKTPDVNLKKRIASSGRSSNSRELCNPSSDNAAAADDDVYCKIEFVIQQGAGDSKDFLFEDAVVIQVSAALFVS